MRKRREWYVVGRDIVLHFVVEYLAEYLYGHGYRLNIVSINRNIVFHNGLMRLFSEKFVNLTKILLPLSVSLAN